MTGVTDHEDAEIDAANASGRIPVVFDSGWREVADTPLAFVQRFT